MTTKRMELNNGGRNLHRMMRSKNLDQMSISKKNNIVEPLLEAPLFRETNLFDQSSIFSKSSFAARLKDERNTLPSKWSSTLLICH